MSIDPTVQQRTIILLTDGAVSNTEEILNYVAKHKKSNRVFTVGIGSGCSTGR